MSTKTCKRCGWVYPITQPGTRCLICGEQFDLVICRECCNVLPIEQMSQDRTLCRTCYNKRQLEVASRRLRAFKEANDVRFNAWLDKVQRVPKDYPTLTEAQWLEACEHFKGCARCTSELIDTRGFFISRALGGRYCDWNIIPVCENCAKIWQLDRNVFTYTYYKERSKNNGYSKYKGASSSRTEYRDCLDKIIEYLEVKLDNALKFTGNTE